MKKKLGIVLVIIITIACIYSGIRTREKNGIVVTQIKTNSAESLSYMLETSENNIIMIDGGSSDDSEHLEELLLEKGGIVEAWYITIAHSQNFGALQEIIENGNIQINGIYISFNSNEWYQEYEPDRYEDVISFLTALSDYNQNVITVSSDFQTVVDNLYISTLYVGNPELNGNYAGFNQSMVIKVDNTYKSMIFMGNIANDGAQYFKDNNLDEINCDAVQISNNGQEVVDSEIYEKMSPDYIFIPTSEDTTYDIEYSADKTYISDNSDVTVKIW